MDPKELVSRMTLEEKASLCSGLNNWYLEGVERLGLPSVMVADGPHGLRKQGSADHGGNAAASIPATCFPTASATACSFDTALLEEIGAAMGEECLAEGVSVILGPGVNIKRSPLCGRNFEYFSEDPFLGGEMAAALITGVQGKGVGTSLKHYAANNQEKARFLVDAVVDERTLREIYLAGFERAVKKARPWTIMHSYNRLNGTYLSENRTLLTEILRDQWGFAGLVMSDWGAVCDRVTGLRAGLDLEMPGPSPRNDRLIAEAVRNGGLDEKILDAAALRVTELILKSAGQFPPDQPGKPKKRGFDRDAHHALARKAAADSAVLLKNEGDLLPLDPGKKGAGAAVIGAFARNPRYQGAGSSQINPTRLDNAWDALRAAGLEAEFAPGYSLEPGSPPDPALIEEAAALARGKDVALVFAGLPAEYESEGFDRASMTMPESHNRLIEAVAGANPNTVVLLQCGSPVEVPWAGKVKSVLLLHLGGQAGGGAAADLILGAANPSGKLAETWPLGVEDNPSFNNFPGGEKTVEYREGLFVGYRYYDKAKREVRWPFGHGLSYTRFAYRDLRADAETFDPAKPLRITLTVENTGTRAGAEVVQIYTAKTSATLIRAEKELKGFGKIHLGPGESGTVGITLDRRSFAWYNPLAGAGEDPWSLEGGPCRILAGSSSRDIRLETTVEIPGDGREKRLASLREKAPAYFALGAAGSLDIPAGDFEALLGRPLPPAARLPGEPYSANSPLGQVKGTPAGKPFYDGMCEGVKAMFSENPGFLRMMQAMIEDLPLRALAMMSGGQITPEQIDVLVAALNTTSGVASGAASGTPPDAATQK